MRTFRAMGTDVSVTAGADEAEIAARVAATFAAAEARLSRFRQTSELAALNRAEGPFVASAELFALLTRARAYVERTGGVFDPAVGGALVALGYDRSFAPGALDRRGPGEPPRAGRLLEVGLEPAGRVVHRPPHLQIDLGGMAKGSTVDRAAVHLGGSGAIDAGGDAFLRGTAAPGEPWLVEIEDPRDPSRTVATIAVCDGAVATSAANRRRWRLGERWAHHLIDPRSQTCAAGDLLQATVFAATTELADVLAKTAFILGARSGRAFLQRQPGVGAVLVPRQGALLLVGELDVREVPHA